MTIRADEITYRRLILVRQLFSRALSQATHLHSPVDKILALVGFDLATETAVKTVISSLETKRQPDRTFHDAITTANSLLASNGLLPLPYEAKIRRVHDLRNDAQHAAKEPSDTDLSAFQTYTSDFLNDLISNVWGIDFETINLIDLIRTESIKSGLNAARTELASANFQKSIVYSILAFDDAKRKIKPAVLGQARLENYTSVDESVVESLRLIKKDVESLRNYVLYLVLGVDFRTYRKFGKITSGLQVFQYADGGFDYNNSTGVVSTESDAIYAFDFVINVVLKMEDFAGNLTNPLDLSNLMVETADE